MKQLNKDKIILDAVIDKFHHFNRIFFKRKLKSPVFSLVNGQRRLGYWNLDSRTLAISREVLSVTSNWYKLEAVLKHEMAHMYVDEVLEAKEVDPHGPLFQQVCQEREFEQSLFEIEEDEFFEKDKIIDKINKLLTLANSPNKNEAESAVKMAEKLMKKWNINSLQNDDRQFAYRQITEPIKRKNYFLKMMAHLLQEHFFVQCIWTWDYNPLVNNGKGKGGYVLDISGAPENLEIAHYVFDYVQSYAKREFKKMKANGGYGTLVNFMAGVARGFCTKLDDQKYDEAKTTESSDLVWVRDTKLDEYFKKRFPSTKTVSGNSSSNRSGFGSGFESGKKMSLSMGVGSKGTGVAGLLT